MGAKRTIVSKAMKDAAFRKRLLQDPRAALEAELGAALPAGVKVQVHEDSPNTINLVLPGPLDVSDRGMSDEQLSQVSGGVVPLSIGGVPLPSVGGNPLPSPLLNPSPLGALPKPGGKISAGDTFGAYTGCCSSGRRMF